VTDDLLKFLRARLDDEERVAREAIADDGDQDGGFEDATWLNDPDSPFTKFGDAAAAMIRTFAVPRRVLAEVDAKRRRIDWLLSLEHDIGEEDFPTYSSCRILNEPGSLGDIEVGYCSCGIDSRRDHLLLIEVQPFVSHPLFRDEWRIA
jgi:hypothetical protein